MPILDQHTFDFFSRSEDQTRRIGARLGTALQRGDVVGLEGDLGAGKTTFVQGVAQGWGSPRAASSPTFVLANEYGRPDGEVLFHVDAYRLASTAEAEDLDIDRMIAEGPLVVEWAERVRAALPGDLLWIVLEHVAEQQRRIEFTAAGERYDHVLQILQHAMFGVA